MNFLTLGITITIVGMGGAFWKTLKIVRWKAAGISAHSMAARVVQMEGRMYDDSYWLLMHAQWTQIRAGKSDPSWPRGLCSPF
jgi:Na+-transporting methylmalonyl-CoA/oxaloacetate decarboxylase beta subunit